MANPSPYAGDPILQALGAAIRRSRLARAMSQEELAELSGVERAQMSGIERGLQNPGVIAIFRIARALEMTLADLFAAARI